MLGLMQDWPLLLHTAIDHAARHHPGREVLTRSVEGPLHRTTWPEVRHRALKVAQRLVRDGIRAGDRVATMAWNTWRHVEAWYGVTGIGAVYHTLNPRLFPEQIAWIVNHAEDRVMLADLTFLPLLEKLAPRLPTIERYVILTDAAHLPATTLPNAVAYEDWISECDGDMAWARLDENAAAGLCYTSGTTGDPKGVLYSHRSNILHAMMAVQPDVFALRSADRVMPVVPMFHANGWILPIAAPLVGAALVLPGARLDGASIHALMEEGRVTFSAAVPTIWAMLLQHLDATGGRLSTTPRVAIGGSAVPRSMVEAYRDRHGVQVLHAWGMTELSPIGTLCAPKPETAGLDPAAQLDLQTRQGIAPYTVDMKITDDAGRELPWDGTTFGRLKVRGPSVTRRYFGAAADAVDTEGWFDTGDVATIDANGYMQVTDRTKDVIKSGGEWISSIALENLAVGHPEVAEAAVVAVPHPKWDERPLLVVVPRAGCSPTKQSLLAFLEGKVAKWWMPDDVAIVPEIPHTATGKVQKTALREMFRDHRLPG
jgi:fatty-acyl-CoA synthase